MDTGSGDATGDIAFSTSVPATLCVNNLAATAFGSSSTGVATAAAVAQGTVATAGTIALALFRNKANTEQFRCAVGTSGSDINLSAVAVSVSDTIDISSLTFTVPAT